MFSMKKNFRLTRVKLEQPPAFRSVLVWQWSSTGRKVVQEKTRWRKRLVLQMIKEVWPGTPPDAKQGCVMPGTNKGGGGRFGKACRERPLNPEQINSIFGLCSPPVLNLSWATDGDGLEDASIFHH